MGLGLSRSFLGLPRRSFGEIGLVALSLCMGQVVTLIVVQGQAKFTLIASEVITHKVWIFREINGLEGESPEPLSAVDGFVLGGGGASAAGL